MPSQQPPLVVSRVLIYAVWSVTPLAWVYVLVACALRAQGSQMAIVVDAVSYTHLTLPTIYSV